MVEAIQYLHDHHILHRYADPPTTSGPQTLAIMLPLTPPPGPRRCNYAAPPTTSGPQTLQLCSFQSFLIMPHSSSSPLPSLLLLHDRDLKTANVFLTKDNNVKVGDFGISKILSETNQEAHTVLGTPYYISPEIVSSNVITHICLMICARCVIYLIKIGAVRSVHCGLLST